MTVSVTDVCGCCYIEVTWPLQCTGSSSSESVVVEVAETDPGSGLWDNTVCDSAWIRQEDKAHLTTTMDAYVADCVTGELIQVIDGVAVCQDFDAKITISNPGDADADNVLIDVSVTGPTDCIGNWDDVSFGTVTGGGSETKWLSDLVPLSICHCEGEGQVRVAVDNIRGEDENTCEAIPVDNIDPVCPLLIDQCEFDVELINPVTCEDICYGDPFAVKARLTNCGTCDLDDVEVTLHWEDCGDVSLIDGSTSNQTIAEILHNPLRYLCGDV